MRGDDEGVGLRNRTGPGYSNYPELVQRRQLGRPGRILTQIDVCGGMILGGRYGINRMEIGTVHYRESQCDGSKRIRLVPSMMLIVSIQLCGYLIREYRAYNN